MLSSDATCIGSCDFCTGTEEDRSIVFICMGNGGFKWGQKSELVENDEPAHWRPILWIHQAFLVAKLLRFILLWGIEMECYWLWRITTSLAMKARGYVNTRTRSRDRRTYVMNTSTKRTLLWQQCSQKASRQYKVLTASKLLHRINDLMQCSLDCQHNSWLPQKSIVGLRKNIVRRKIWKLGAANLRYLFAIHFIGSKGGGAMFMKGYLKCRAIRDSAQSKLLL